jgi:hypothetical protein
MTARHEAIVAMFDADTDVTISYTLATRLLDAIPPHVKARLAIDEGAFESRTLAHWWASPVELDADEQLYRVVEP